MKNSFGMQIQILKKFLNCEKTSSSLEYQTN